MNDFKYRFATIEDIPQLAVLFQQVFMDTYGINGISVEFTKKVQQLFSYAKLQEFIVSNDYDLWVVTYEENLVGALQVDYDKAAPIGNLVAPEINKLYVLRRFFGKGIGQQLMEKAEQLLKEKGHECAWLWVLHSNQRAIDFYEKQEYKTIGTADLQLEVNSYTNLVMKKNL